MVPVKSFMVPKDKFITVERDIDVRTAGRTDTSDHRAPHQSDHGFL